MGRLLVALGGMVALLGPADAESSSKAFYRFTPKFICGAFPEGHSVHKGDYRTTITIYNPGHQELEFRYQAVISGSKEAQDPNERAAQLSREQSKNIKGRRVEIFDCKRLAELYHQQSTQLTEPGFGVLVITTDRQLDVTTVHTTAGDPNQSVTGISVSEVSRQFGQTCAATDIDLSKRDVWQDDNSQAPRAVDRSKVRSRYDRKRDWMSYDARATVGANEHVYFLKYCVCSGRADFVDATVRSESDSSGKLTPDGIELWTMETGKGNWLELDPQTRQPNPPAPITGSTTTLGDGTIEVRVGRGVNTSAISFKGILRLTDGHAGACTK
jgi:hypothetical protein